VEHKFAVKGGPLLEEIMSGDLHDDIGILRLIYLLRLIPPPPNFTQQPTTMLRITYSCP
jgi:hypothetical protein